MVIAQTSAFVLAFLMDLIFGDPDFPLHPIRLIGGLIWMLEKVIRKIFPKGKAGEIIGGILTVALVTAVSGGVPLVILFFAYRLNMAVGVIAEALICYFMLAARSLKKSSMRVYSSLMRGDIEGARKNVSMIVGRDTQSLDDIGITKAAVETVAENTSDGVTAPLMYMAIGGAFFGCVYKAINTMDSMLGYKNDKYINFGKAAARLDDAVNYIPSRISARLMIFASKILGLDSKNASYIHKRDARKHASPNSAQTESVMAGALRIQLAGDAYYFGELYKKPFIGDDIKDVQFTDIVHANKLMYMTAFLTFLICTLLRIMVCIGIYFIPRSII